MLCSEVAMSDAEKESEARCKTMLNQLIAAVKKQTLEMEDLAVQMNELAVGLKAIVRPLGATVHVSSPSVATLTATRAATEDHAVVTAAPRAEAAPAPELPTRCSTNCSDNDTASQTSALLPDAAPGSPSTIALLDVAIPGPNVVDAKVLDGGLNSEPWLNARPMLDAGGVIFTGTLVNTHPIWVTQLDTLPVGASLSDDPTPHKDRLVVVQVPTHPESCCPVLMEIKADDIMLDCYIQRLDILPPDRRKHKKGKDAMAWLPPWPPPQTVSSIMGNNIMGMAAKPNHGKSKQTRNRRRANVQFENLLEEVLCTILSKLPTKEAVRTCVLSSKWRSTWMIFPKLRFNGVAMLGHNRYLGEEYCRKFIDNVNTVLQQLHGNVVEELDVKFEVNSMLVDHLNSWVSFVVSSRTKKLAFDLVPAKLGGLDDKYNFPFELLDSERISCLYHIQLSFVSLKLPSQFRGFPKLRKLDLHYLHVTRKDLQCMLSNCCNHEWLSIARCHLDDELKVDRPLYSLLHLEVSHCRISKIEFHAMKLSTFVYKGQWLPIDLSQSSELNFVTAETEVLHLLAPTVVLRFCGFLPRIQKPWKCLQFGSDGYGKRVDWTRLFSIKKIVVQLKRAHAIIYASLIYGCGQTVYTYTILIDNSEVLQKCYGPEADVWSAGAILYIVLCGVPPFWKETEAGIFRQNIRGKLDFESEPWPIISDNTKDLVCNMLNRDPGRRLTAHELLCHPWIVDDAVAPDKPIDSAVLSRLKQLTEHEIQALMEAADIDNSGTIDYGEFIGATLHMNKLEREENLLSAFSFFDKDGSGLLTMDELAEACHEFELMGKNNVQPNHVTSSIMLKVMKKSKTKTSAKEAWEFFQQMNRKGVKWILDVFASLIKIFGEEGPKKEALIIQSEMEKRGIASNRSIYNTLMNVYCNSNQIEEAEGFFVEMKVKGLKPTTVSYNILMDAYSRRLQPEVVESLLLEMQDFGLRPNARSYNCLMSAYGRQKKMSKKAEDAFLMMKTDGKASYTSLLCSYVVNGQPEKAHITYVDMKREGLKPSLGTYTTLLDTFRRDGDTEKLMETWKSMMNARVGGTRVTFHMVVEGVQVRLGMEVLLIPWDPGGNGGHSFVSAWGQAAFQGGKNVTDQPSFGLRMLGRGLGGEWSRDYVRQVTGTEARHRRIDTPEHSCLIPLFLPAANS